MDIEPPEHDFPILDDQPGHDDQVELPGDYSPNGKPVLELIDLNLNAQRRPHRYIRKLRTFLKLPCLRQGVLDVPYYL
jgi:hypothetical protein